MEPGVASRLRSVFATRMGAKPGEGKTADLQRRIETALAGELGTRLGLSEYKVRSGHYLHVIGRGAHGKLFVSFFPGSQRERAGRIVASQQLLRDAGVDTPEVLDSDAGVQDPELAWVALRWHEGRNARLRDVPAARKALAQLARIHGIDREAQLQAGNRDIVETLPVGPDLRAQPDWVGWLTGTLAKAGVELPRKDVARVREFLQVGVDSMGASMPAPPIVLLHGDYHPANLRLTPEGRLLILDLEGSSFGAFPVDLARALLKFRYKVGARQLDGLRLEQLLDDPRLAELQEAYLEEAPEEARKFWVGHGRTALFVGYLAMVARRAKAALNPRRYGARKGRQSLRQALRRWQQAVRYVERKH